MIDPNETDDDKRKRELLLIFRRGYAAGVRGSAYDPRFTAHERGEVREAYLRAYSHGADDAHLAAAKEAGYSFRCDACRRARHYDPEYECPEHGVWALVRDEPPMIPRGHWAPSVWSGGTMTAPDVCTLHATNASRIQRRWWTWCESIGTCPYSGAIWGRVSSACGMGGIGAGVKWGRMRSGGRCHD